MLFKQSRIAFLRVIALGLTLTTLAACGLKTGEDPYISNATEIQGVDTDGLKESRGLWNRLYEGKATEQEIEAFWGEITKSLETLKKRVKGKHTGRYAYEEFRAFLRRFFLSEKQISDAMLERAMEVKVILVGGKPDELTHAEIDRLKQFFESLSKVFVEYRDLLPFDNERLLRMGGRSRLEYVARMRQAATALGKVLGTVQKPCAREWLDSFFQEIQKVVARFDFAPYFERESLWWALKAAALNSSQTEMQPRDWLSLGVSFVDAYALYLDARLYRRTPGVWSRGAKLERIRPLFSDFNRLMMAIVARYPKGVIPFAVVDGMIDRLKPSELPLGLSAEKLKQFLRPAFRRILSGTDRSAQGRAANGLTRSMLQRVYKEAASWHGTQTILDRLYRLMERDRGLDLRGDASLASAFERKDLVARLRADARKGEIWPGWEKDKNTWPMFGRAVSMVTSVSAFFQGRSQIASFDPRSGELPLSYHNMTMQHWMWVVSDLSIRAYAADPSQDFSLTSPEFEAFLRDLIPTGIELRWVDPNPGKVKTLPRNRFREANLFTPHGNANQTVTVSELVDLIALLLSGDQWASKAHSRLYALCPHRDSDAYGFPEVETDCFVREFKRQSASLFETVPGMLEYYQSLDDAEKDEFLKLSFKAIDVDLNARRWVSHGDTQVLLVLYQYVELLFDRFDTMRLGVKGYGRDGKIDEVEAVPAFWHFKTELKAQTGIEDEWKLRGGFNYLLAYGEMPTEFGGGWEIYKAERINEKIKQLPFLDGYEPFKWEYQSDRMIIVKIFKVLQDLVSRKAAKDKVSP